MLFRMIRGVLFHQRGKMLLIAVTIALGASLATGMLNVVMDVEDKVNKELKNYGANIIVKPKDASLLSDIYDTGESGALNEAYLLEDELGKLKTIFWAFNIVDFTPFLDTTVAFSDGTDIKMVGTWFNHHLSLPLARSWTRVSPGCAPGGRSPTVAGSTRQATAPTMRSWSARCWPNGSDGPLGNR